MGYVRVWEDGGAKTVFEADTISCTHCQKVLNKATWREAGGWCPQCGHAVCHPCAQIMHVQGCLPWRKKIDMAWDRLMRRDQL